MFILNTFFGFYGITKKKKKKEKVPDFARYIQMKTCLILLEVHFQPTIQKSDKSPSRILSMVMTLLQEFGTVKKKKKRQKSTTENHETVEPLQTL